MGDVAGLGAATMLRPRAIVIVGASDRSRWSQTVYGNLRGGGFGGAVHLVSPHGDTVHGALAAQSCRALGQAVDLGLILAPAHAVGPALDDLASTGAQAAIILTSGFAETGAQGAQAQRALADQAAALGIRLLGPNSLGFMNFVDRTHVWATPVRAPSRPSGVAIISQSGATAHFLANLAVQQDVGLSIVVSTGNEIDLDCTDFIGVAVDDPATRAVALFMETVRAPAAFLAAVQAAAAAGKPLVVLKAGVSAAAVQSALAHTGALTGDDRLFDAVCRQFGAIRVHALEDLLATADLGGRTGPLGAGGLAVVSNSGGICEIAGDTAQALGIDLPALAAGTAADLAAVLPGFATPHNPLDLTGGITPAQCEQAVALLATQPGVAAVLCPYYEVPTSEPDVTDRLTALHLALARGLAGAPVPGFVVSMTATHLTALSRRIVAETGLPYLACGLDGALTALAGLLDWSRRRAQVSAPHAPPCGPGAMLPYPHSEHAALTYLAAWGVPVVPTNMAHDEGAAWAAAQTLGGAAVLKVASPDIAHKSDIGGVALNLRGEHAVRGAYRQIMQNVQRQAPLADIEGVLVAPMRPPGIELFAGLWRDAQWGPVLAAGLGGVWVEVFDDVALRLLPVTPGEVRQMLASLRGAKVLAGARDLPAADLDAVASVVARIGDAALALGPALQAFDVNPLWVRGAEVQALDALCVWRDGALAA